MIAQIGPKPRGDRLGNFDGGELDRALSERTAGQRRNRDGLRAAAIEESLDLAVADHAIEQAGPAGALAGLEHRTHQRKNSAGLHQQPRCLGRHPLLIQFGQLSFEIIVHERDRQVGRSLYDADAEFA